MGRQRHDKGQQKRRRAALARNNSTPDKTTDGWAQHLVERGLAARNILDHSTGPRARKDKTR